MGNQDLTRALDAFVCFLGVFLFGLGLWKIHRQKMTPGTFFVPGSSSEFRRNMGTAPFWLIIVGALMTLVMLFFHAIGSP